MSVDKADWKLVKEETVIFGTDKLSGRLRQCLSKEMTPVVHYIFTRSFCAGEITTEWTQANVTPILKKEDHVKLN